ncbi:hypothetical protein BDV93DRAFT_42070 [Ceratobasidium sp. AG-I]|nr:hypothetical protein BDV93DRAFT_42070 [Ceratobasidium sp. AG-I]
MTNAREKFSKAIRIKVDTMKPSASRCKRSDTRSNCPRHQTSPSRISASRCGTSCGTSCGAFIKQQNERPTLVRKPACAWSGTGKIAREVGRAEVDAVELVNQARRTGEMNMAVETQSGNTRSYALRRRYGDEMETAGTKMREFRYV